MIDLDKLEALAKSATPGPWFYQDESDAYTHIVRPVDNPGRIIASGTQTSDARGETTGRFIAAANPSTVLELIALIRELAVVSIPVIKEGVKIEGGETVTPVANRKAAYAEGFAEAANTIRFAIGSDGEENEDYRNGWMDGMHEAASLITGDEPTGADVESQFAALLPCSYYMDPPDGGSVTVLEQVGRMAEDAAKWRAHEAAVPAAPVSDRQKLILAAIDTGHSICDEEVVLVRDESKPGNALSQLGDRLAANLPATAPVADTAPTPAGWKLVPLEPTLAMIAALGWEGDEDLAIGHAHISNGIAESWTRAVDAAPAPGSAQ